MKKIVALALCLIMALSLATVAFGATPAYLTTDVTNLATTGSEFDSYTYSLEQYTPAIEAAKQVATYKVWKTDKTSSAKTEVNVGTTYVKTDAKNATAAFVDGSKITYLYVNASAWDVKGATVVKGDATSAAAATNSCDKTYIPAAESVYTSNGKYYVSVTGGAKNVVTSDGLLINATEYDTKDDMIAAVSGAVGAHQYDMDVAAYNGTTKATKVFCTECNKEFKFVQGDVTDAITAFGAGNYDVTTLTVGADVIYVQTASGTTAAEGVTSAKTFDAGVALYAGMALMSVAGSAVVIGKKKEF